MAATFLTTILGSINNTNTTNTTTIPSKSRDGFSYTVEPERLTRGLKTRGYVRPSIRGANPNKLYDCIVVGAGYAGLTTARDLTAAGLHVLLIEARDRIGGRTYTAEVDGCYYDMGGQYVHWAQPNFYREVSRYGLQGELIAAKSGSRLHAAGERGNELENEFNQLLRDFVNLNINVNSSVTQPISSDSTHIPTTTRRLADISVQDRLDQLSHQEHSAQALTLLKSYIRTLTGIPNLSHISFRELLKCRPLRGSPYASIRDLIEHGSSNGSHDSENARWGKGSSSYYRFKQGQSCLARAVFYDACRTGRLAYAFGTRVWEVGNGGCDGGKGEVRVDTDLGGFKARRVVVTVPRSVLGNVRIDGEFGEGGMLESSCGGASRRTVTLHVETKEDDVGAWDEDGCGKAGELDAGISVVDGDDKTLFSLSQNRPRPRPSDDAKTFLANLSVRNPKAQVERVLWHDWSSDEFARDTRGSLPTPPQSPTAEKSPVSSEAPRERKGNILFAGADWAAGWNGCIEGAIEDGARAAVCVREELV